MHREIAEVMGLGSGGISLIWLITTAVLRIHRAFFAPTIEQIKDTGNAFGAAFNGGWKSVSRFGQPNCVNHSRNLGYESYIELYVKTGDLECLERALEYVRSGENNDLQSKPEPKSMARKDPRPNSPGNEQWYTI